MEHERTPEAVAVDGKRSPRERKRLLHDRIQQAAYSLIPEADRAEVHLRIGRALLASMTTDELAEQLFDVANQLNRGAARLIRREEKAQVAMIELRAGRKAKASAAYASACVYLATGMRLPSLLQCCPGASLGWRHRPRRHDQRRRRRQADRSRHNYGARVIVSSIAWNLGEM